jgi:hypothetical protein
MIARLLIFILLAGMCFGQNTAKFPAATATFQDLAVATDVPNRSVLSAGIDNATLTVPVTDGTKFAQYNIITFADNAEQAMVCSISANTLTLCSRGFGGTTAASHGIGIGVLGNVTAWHHNQLAAEVKAIETALGVNLANVASNVTWSTLSGHPTALSAFSNDVGFYSGSYTDPSWLTITKSKVGLGSVEDTALSTWSGTSNITTIGTLSAGTVPWARLSNVPTTFTPAVHTHSISDLSTVGDYSSKITSGTYSIGITGNAGTVGTYAANKIPNAYTHDASWTWIDNYLALPTGTSYIQWGVFTPQAAAATVTSVVCWSSTNAAVIQLRNSNGSDFITSNLTCNGTATTTLTANAALSLGQYVGMYEVSGTATWISVAIKYTTSY